MKKYLFLVATSLMALASCGDDDSKTTVAKLDKLTQVTCYLNDNATPLYRVEINYRDDGEIANMQVNNEDKLQFIYVGNTLTVGNSGPQTVEYSLSGHAITKEKVSKENPYANNEIYVSDEYSYKYKGANLYTADWTTRWPKNDGSGYETRSYTDVNAVTYAWENGNVTRFSQDKKEMVYEYTEQVRPQNFPLRVIDSFAPTGFEVFTPINLLFGNQNKNLPKRSYWYVIPATSDPSAEYEYTYDTIIGDYITAMTIEETCHTPSGEIRNTYKYTFEYNYKVK